MESNYYELTLQLWDLLTKEDREKGCVWVQFDYMAKSEIAIGSSMLDQIKKKSCYRDHIIGFKRIGNEIHLILDKEGQEMWDIECRKMMEFCEKYNE